MKFIYVHIPSFSTRVAFEYPEQQSKNRTQQMGKFHKKEEEEEDRSTLSDKFLS